MRHPAWQIRDDVGWSHSMDCRPPVTPGTLAQIGNIRNNDAVRTRRHKAADYIAEIRARIRQRLSGIVRRVGLAVPQDILDIVRPRLNDIERIGVRSAAAEAGEIGIALLHQAEHWRADRRT